MSHAASAPDPEDPAPADEAPPDPAVLRAERRLRLLEQLAEIGMRLALALETRVLAENEAVKGEGAGPAAADAPGRDPAAAFAQLSRAIRLTLSLEARTDAELRDLEAGIVRQREEKRAKAAERVNAAAAERTRERRGEIETLFAYAAAAEGWTREDFEQYDNDIEERLGEDEALWNDPERSLRDIIERLCRYFHLSPDWSRWDEAGWTWENRPPATWTTAPKDALRWIMTDPPEARHADPAPAAAHALE